MRKLKVAAIVMSLFIPSQSAKAEGSNPAVPTILVSQFGTKCDGKSDDTAAIRKAAAAVPETGASLIFPSGVCVIYTTIYIKSHTHVAGRGSTLLAGTPFFADHKGAYALLENVHFDAHVLTDSDIEVKNMIFDYGTFASVATPGGGKHAVRFEYVRDASITGSIFLLRGAEDAVAGLGVENMLVLGNSAYEFRNCAYDFWSGPSNVQVLDNFAETTDSKQMVNFNPEKTHGDSSGEIARSFTMTDNVLIGRGVKAIPLQIEPLGQGTKVQNIVVVRNTLINSFLVLRGIVQGATIKRNTIVDVAGGSSAFVTYPHWGGAAESITFSDNLIVNPQTLASELGTIRMEAFRSSVENNVIVGTAYNSAAIYRGHFVGSDSNNTVGK